MTSEADRAYWDAESDTFDDEPDHGLRDPDTAAAWRELLGSVLPEPSARVADLGCGTGSLAVLLAIDGYQVDGVDFAPAMVAQARTKAASTDRAVAGLSVVVGDAGAPPLRDGAYDVVLVRHVTWALPDRSWALHRWHHLLRPGGRLVLVEGFWSTGAGLHADDVAAAVGELFDDVRVRHLTDPRLWGRAITDERYLLTGIAKQGVQ